MSFTTTQQQYPLKDIPQPHPHDVLCGRGGGTNAHVGNSHWRMLVQANKELYVSLPKRQKMLLSKSIVNAVRSQNPPGRFLQKDTKTDLWYDVGDQRAQEKTSQALREGAPDIRNKMKHEKQTTAEPLSSRDLHSTSFSSNDGSASGGYAPNGAPMYAGVSPSMMMPPAIPPPVEPQGPVPNRRSSSQNGKNTTGHYQEYQTAPTNNSLNPPSKLDTTPIVEPPAGLDPDQQFSFGSIGMTDMEQARLMNGYSMGSTMDYMPSAKQQEQGQPVDHGHYQPQARQHHQQQQPYQQKVQFSSSAKAGKDDVADAVAPVDGGLEPAGLSFGSVMSISTADIKLEPGGLSFGSMMSFVREEAGAPPAGQAAAPEAVDGGLEAIGTSFGSLSLATTDRNQFVESMGRIDEAQEAVEAPPTFLSQQKSKGNLLDCSDTDSDDEQDSAQASAQKSADWEKLQATLAAQNYDPKASAVTPPSIFPPGGLRPQTLDIPATTLDRDFSQMSAISVGEDFSGFDQHVVPEGGPNEPHDPVVNLKDTFDMPPPPAAMKKQESDGWEPTDHIQYAYANHGH